MEEVPPVASASFSALRRDPILQPFHGFDPFIRKEVLRRSAACVYKSEDAQNDFLDDPKE